MRATRRRLAAPSDAMDSDPLRLSATRPPVGALGAAGGSGSGGAQRTIHAVEEGLHERCAVALDLDELGVERVVAARDGLGGRHAEARAGLSHLSFEYHEQTLKHWRKRCWRHVSASSAGTPLACSCAVDGSPSCRELRAAPGRQRTEHPSCTPLARCRPPAPQHAPARRNALEGRARLRSDDRLGRRWAAGE
jgi:hypothetical protein